MTILGELLIGDGSMLPLSRSFEKHVLGTSVEAKRS
jgi:hypothetical protein